MTLLEVLTKIVNNRDSDENLIDTNYIYNKLLEEPNEKDNYTLFMKYNTVNKEINFFKTIIDNLYLDLDKIYDVFNNKYSETLNISHELYTEFFSTTITAIIQDDICDYLDAPSNGVVFELPFKIAPKSK